ncbi:hypothetical protein E2C01_015326 [Portunus trituberculatus]|uniref:Uncharacterized protein n=1 Tax=Portunus trituberculatus TaxID=210409 RepID=A0A5B7DM99_PORTR|nr:hypothetical protein [Portunus trituberculatus]
MRLVALNVAVKEGTVNRGDWNPVLAVIGTSVAHHHARDARHGPHHAHGNTLGYATPRHTPRCTLTPRPDAHTH